MNKEELFQKIRTEIENKIRFLNDKPEETLDSTLKALWHKAAECPVSAERADHMELSELTEIQIKNLYQLIELRLNNTPLAHLTGRQSFMGIELLTDNRALIPRKETELLGKKAIELSRELTKIRNKVVRIIDVCCGSGNLGLAIAYYNPDCLVYATDISQDAVDLTKDNIHFLKLNNKVQAEQGDLLSAFEKDEFYEKTDLIVCNPPYILSANVPKMDSEISSNEPELAFDGGMLGIKVIQRLIREAPKFLTNDGCLIFEVGAGQGNLITQLCERSDLFQNIESITDNTGIIRVIKAQKNS